MSTKIKSIIGIYVSSTSEVTLASGTVRLYTDKEFFTRHNMFESSYRDLILKQIL